jgi:hypothetical protein
VRRPLLACGRPRVGDHRCLQAVSWSGRTSLAATSADSQRLRRTYAIADGMRSGGGPSLTRTTNVKIRQLTIRNVTSYRGPTTFDFDNRINILIGPNGGGKSNLQRILAVVLSNYFIHQYDFTHTEEQAAIKPISLWTKRIIQENLDKFTGERGDQEITIQLLPEESDLRNIEQIGAHLDDFNEHLSYWESPITRYDPMHFVDAIRESGGFTYHITNMEIQALEPHSPAWAFREYLRTFFIFMRLSGRISGLDLTSPVFFFFRNASSIATLEFSRARCQSVTTSPASGVLIRQQWATRQIYCSGAASTLPDYTGGL